MIAPTVNTISVPPTESPLPSAGTSNTHTHTHTSACCSMKCHYCEVHLRSLTWQRFCVHHFTVRLELGIGTADIGTDIDTRFNPAHAITPVLQSRSGKYKVGRSPMRGQYHRGGMCTGCGVGANTAKVGDRVRKNLNTDGADKFGDVFSPRQHERGVKPHRDLRLLPPHYRTKRPTPCVIVRPIRSSSQPRCN
jgi:hypothetical protein